MVISGVTSSNKSKYKNMSIARKVTWETQVIYYNSVLLPFAELDDFGNLDNPSFLERAAVMAYKLKDSNIKTSTYNVHWEEQVWQNKYKAKTKHLIDQWFFFLQNHFIWGFNLGHAIQRLKKSCSRRE